ncbi:hypothetical protein KY330_04145 [Candidatus Woesearchaeota archaeon]|nr:hypothetical protein [Candidatus Woesearchaeota archaeon]
MALMLWLTLGILILFLVIALLIYKFSKLKKHEPDYYAFFILGICWFPLGFALNNHAFTIMGLVFMVLGLANRDKWKKNKPVKWKDMKKNERIIYSLIVALLGILVLAGLVMFLLVNKGLI